MAPMLAAHSNHVEPFKLVDFGLERPELRVVAQVSAGITAPSAASLPQSQPAAPLISKAFDPFVKTGAIRTRFDDRFLFVESTGLPDHQMMVGITSWQQHVPLPQPFTGSNAWQIPLRPVPAAAPRSTNGYFLRGAIALAVNGVPIFNPLNNRNEDAYRLGELDLFGGHCGRADDYHYHIAPVHLQKTTGIGVPIAFALDGYPLYGYTEADGTSVTGLDSLNGHADTTGNYHYHATKTYPYLNGGFHGEVTEREGQVDPQPRGQPLRPATTPLRGARITDFAKVASGANRLTYEVNGSRGIVEYALTESGAADFTFIDPAGNKTTARYERSNRPNERRKPPPPPSK